MGIIHVNRLSRQERCQLEERRFSLDELTALHAALERGQRKRIRAFRLVACSVLAISAVLLIMTGCLTGMTPAFAFSAIAVLVLDIVCLLLVWVLGIHLFAQQFNDAVDRGYPELVGRLHL